MKPRIVKPAGKPVKTTSQRVRFVSVVTGKEQREAEKPGNCWGGGNRQASRGSKRPRAQRP